MPFGPFKINELAMAEYYGVSRTVTRDLLGRLEARGLVEKAGRSQCFLPELTAELMSDLYEVRRLLEPTALLDAAPHLARERLEGMREDLREAVLHAFLADEFRSSRAARLVKKIVAAQSLSADFDFASSGVIEAV